ncbi:hypothetical protein Tco_0772395 [Tanacetum coccineum]|uniref:Uncharacterized protein n=1 Tax=Tanacetum coccineum TaxID=301880 RepID=A0ABQ4ZHS4_9ASTR
MASLKIQPEIIKDLELIEVKLVARGFEGHIASLKIEPKFILRIKESQKENGELWSVLQNLKEGKQAEFWVDDNGVIWYGNRLCVLDDSSLREAVLTVAHSSPFSIHPGSTKMFRDLKQKNLVEWYLISKLVEIFQQDIIRLHDTPASIVSLIRIHVLFHVFGMDCRIRWEHDVGLELLFHSQIDGQVERPIHTLEAILRSCLFG